MFHPFLSGFRTQWKNPGCVYPFATIFTVAKETEVQILSIKYLFAIRDWGP